MKIDNQFKSIDNQWVNEFRMVFLIIGARLYLIMFFVENGSVVVPVGHRHVDGCGGGAGRRSGVGCPQRQVVTARRSLAIEQPQHGDVELVGSFTRRQHTKVTVFVTVRYLQRLHLIQFIHYSPLFFINVSLFITLLPFQFPFSYWLIQVSVFQ